MRSDDRRDLATATTGAAGLAAGGVGRHAAVEGLQKKPRVHAIGVLRGGSKNQKRLYLGSSALGLAAAPALAVGTTRLVTGRDIEKADKEPSFWAEGLRGSVGALRGRAENAVQPVPKEVRATQLGVAAGAGLSGSALARQALRGRAKVGHPVVAPVIGGLAATASIPGTNRLIERRGYQATANGVKRVKQAPVRPSSRASQFRGQPRSFREDLSKAESYLGSRTPHLTQRAAITAAGHPPLVGPLTQAAAAGSYAPPGQQKKQTLRQYGMASFAPLGVGAAGAYGGAALAARSPRFERGAERALQRVDRVEGAVRSRVGMKPKVGLMDKPATSFAGRNRDRFLNSGAGKKLLGADPMKWKARSVGAGAGFLGAKMLGGAVLGQAAISLNQRDQKRYNAKHGVIAKAGPDLGTREERSDLSRKKRTSAVLSGAGGVAGLTGLGLLALKRKEAATTAGIIGGGFGGTNALLNVPIQRKEAKAIDPVKKLANLAKRDSLEIRHGAEHPKLLQRYGDKGPLPRGLDRDTKMKAYEARYVRHGGDKADKWGRRAEAAEGVRNAGLAGATVGGAAWLASRTKAGTKVAGKASVRARRMADTVAVGSGVAGGAAELYGEHARGKRSSYTNSPAGVAGSALRRMRDYTPD